MIPLKSFKLGKRVKGYIIASVISILVLIILITKTVLSRLHENSTDIVLIIVFIVLSSIFIYKSVEEVIKCIVVLAKRGYIDINIDEDLEELIDDDVILLKGPKIVVIGGGTGLSTMLRGLKNYTSNITAIVTVGDDGGGSGVLREDLGILPPGDIRNCILALARTEPLMEELLQYRFKDGRLKNQNFGNLFLAAMDGISDNFEDAVQKMSSVLAVKGKVLPVTLEDMVLEAELENGNKVRGESIIGEEVIEQDSRIKKLKIFPEDAKALDDAILAIEDADAIVLGPGSLYTSILPNLLVKDITRSIKKSKALKLYICNIMTQPGETQKFSVSDHIKVIFDHCGRDIIDCVIANEESIHPDLRDKYYAEGSDIVNLDIEELEKLGVDVVKDDLTETQKTYVRHNAQKLAKIIIETVMERKMLYDRNKILEYIYLCKKIKTRDN
ncbi:LPPG:FO 2-phospho-L-lactate transferase [Sarcina ventriculi]|uniref:gluconeogenesis factor YvcK family protein n=1 Tax=Sarcina ventriculi TaxID=1267 RepID=UPI000DA034CE|nr:gluconeogenesis factor YvcK family protein [Sarcina ventriculi]SPZ49477.1 LPPG:FO 2-phospho-L-lactate transferase [Sarcina ventriculi]